MAKSKSVKKVVTIVVAVVIVLAAGLWAVSGLFGKTPTAFVAAASRKVSQSLQEAAARPKTSEQSHVIDSFPAVSLTGLHLTGLQGSTGVTPSASKLLQTLQAQYREQNPGTYYAQGTKESWCADFVSWVYDQSDLPFKNPNTGSWRIPGVYTLQQYFQQAGTFHAFGEKGFTPQFGDVVMYAPNSPAFHQHTNIVLSYKDGELTTIGGNQGGDGNKHIVITKYALNSSDLVIVGFGRPALASIE